MTEYRLRVAVGFALLVLATSVNGQGSDVIDEVVVTGIRASQEASLDVKRNSKQFVDVVTAIEVGKFPDANIADSLQRVPGVAIERSGGEGRFITVRGLGPEFNTVLVNGRTMATDNDGREFSFDVLASSIISRAEVFKTPTARLQEGAIGGTVNIITHRPLSLPEGLRGNVSLGATHDELAEDNSPDVSAFFSQNSGNWAVAASMGYSDRAGQQDQAAIDGWVFGSQQNITGGPDSSGLGPADISSLEQIHTPQNVVFQRDEEDRERMTGSLTFQAELASNIEVSVDGLYSSFDIDSTSNLITPFFTQPFIDIQTDSNDSVTEFFRPGQRFLENNPLLGVPLAQNDNVLSSRDRDSESTQVGANLKWRVMDDFLVTADLSTSSAERQNVQPFIVLGTLAVTAPQFQLNPGNDIPSVTNMGDLSDPDALRNHFARINKTDVTDDITEFRLEGDWNLDLGPLTTVSFGTLVSNREKDRQFARTVFEAACAYCGYAFPNDPSIVSPLRLDDFLQDASGSDAIPRDGFTYDAGDVLAWMGLEANLRNPARRGGLTQAEADAEADRLLALPGGPFAPQLQPRSSSNVEEEVISVFLSTDWAGDFRDEFGWAANLGVRISKTDTTSTGFGEELTRIFQTAGTEDLFFEFAPPAAIRVRNEYTNVLPSLNVKMDVAEDKLLRFAIAKTLTRPTLTSLGTDNQFSRGVVGRSAVTSGGNPELEPFESLNWDLSFEWYYSYSSFLGLAGFHKEFEQFLESQTLPIDTSFEDANGDLQPFTIQDTRTRNGEDGSITGAELAFQHTFSGGALDGFGFVTNYTYVTSDVDRTNDSSATECDYNGLSPHTVNVSGFYEGDRLETRVAYNWRDDFLVACFAAEGRPASQEAYGQVDMSIRYNFTDRFEVFADVVNLLDEDTRSYSVFESRFLEYVDTGRRFTLGVRGSL